MKSNPKAISYGRLLKTENVRFRMAKSTINPHRPEKGNFSSHCFGYHFRDGLQPEKEPLFRTTSASETGFWIWVSTHRGKHTHSNEPKTAAQQHKPHLPSTAVPHNPRARLRHYHEPMESDSDGVESLAFVLTVR